MVVVVVPPRNYQLSALPPIKTLTPTLTLNRTLVIPISGNSEVVLVLLLILY